MYTMYTGIIIIIIHVYLVPGTSVSGGMGEWRNDSDETLSSDPVLCIPRNSVSSAFSSTKNSSMEIFDYFL